MSTAFPRPAPDEAAEPGPLKVPIEQLRGVLGGVREVNYVQGHDRLAVVESRLA
jgi:hypothetical protein